MNSQITTKYMLDYCSKELTGTTRQRQATKKRQREEDKGRSQLHKLGNCAMRENRRGGRMGGKEEQEARAST